MLEKKGHAFNKFIAPADEDTQAAEAAPAEAESAPEEQAPAANAAPAKMKKVILEKL
jgi:hypothetical protein